MQTVLRAPSGPLSVELGDLNGDGLLDLVTANEPSNTAAVMQGLGDGTFGVDTIYTLSAGGAAVALRLSDINQDGRLDFVAAGEQSGSVRLGTGTGRFGPNTAFTLPSRMTGNPGAMALADVNGDGRLDVVTVSKIADAASVQLGASSNTFGPSTFYPTGFYSQPEAITVADFNADGRLDLATANGGNNTVGVLLGQGTGGFGPATTYSIGNGSFTVGVAAADVNGDNRLDLVSANNSGSVSVFLGLGSGSFSTAVTYSVAPNPVGIVVRDVTGDGAPDVLTAGFGSNVLSVLPGLGNGTFGPVANYDTGPNSSPISLAVGDLNSDGAPDVVTANFGSVSAGVLLSLRPIATLNGPASGTAGSSLTLRGTRLTGTTAVTFTSPTRAVTTVPASSFTGTSYQTSPQTITLSVPTSLAAGTYTVAVVTPQGTSPQTAFTITSPLGVAATWQAAGSSVFPNPAHESATVLVSPLPGATRVVLSLYDALGRAVRTHQLPLPATGFRHELDLRGLAPGLYRVQVQASSARTTQPLHIE